MKKSELADRLAGQFPGLKLRHGETVEKAEPGFHPHNLRAGLMALPASVEELSSLMAYCSEHGIAIVPQGGRTGLAGGAVSADGQLIISTQRMNQILSIDGTARLAVVEAGVTLAALQSAAAEHGLSPGIDLGARDTATIGGMISTNAGGIEAFRNGVMRGRVSGLEAVLPDGSVMSDLTQVSKCNEGLDVKQLFIGAEGTLGIVTRAVIRLVPLALARATALVVAPDAARAIATFHALAKSGSLLAFELMNPRYFRLAARAAHQESLLPLADEGFVFILEMQGQDQGMVQDALGESLAAAMERRELGNAILAKSLTEAREFWVLREDSWVVDRSFAHCMWFDVTVPLQHLDHYLLRLDADLAKQPIICEAYAIGHLGDGNLHITVAAHESLSECKSGIERAVYAGIKELGGSFSAEHGIGLEKKAALLKYGDIGKRSAMLAVKRAFDPKNIMNPGKIY